MKTVFVLTLSDIFGLVMLGLVVLFLAVTFAVSVYQDWKRGRAKKRKEATR